MTSTTKTQQIVCGKKMGGTMMSRQIPGCYKNFLLSILLFGLLFASGCGGNQQDTGGNTGTISGSAK